MNNGFKITYRQANKKDLPNILDMYNQAVKAMLKSGIDQWHDLYPGKSILEKDISNKHMTIGVKNNELVCAYVLNDECEEEYKNGDWKYPDSKFCVVHRLCVNPLFQNQGLGNKIMSRIEKQSKESGYQTIRLDSFTKNPYSAKLYSKLGYEIVGFVYWSKGKFYLREKKL